MTQLQLPLPIEATQLVHDAPSSDRDAIRDAIGSGLYDTISSLFDTMAIAEEEIARAKRSASNEHKRQRIHGSVRYLCPTDPIRGLHTHVYRAHARELIARAAADSPALSMNLGTEAEALGALSAHSLAAPPDSIATLLYHRLFQNIFPEATDVHWDTPHTGIDHYEHEADALLSTLRRKISTPRSQE